MGTRCPMSKYYLPTELEPHLIIKPMVIQVRNLLAEYIATTKDRRTGYFILGLLRLKASPHYAILDVEHYIGYPWRFIIKKDPAIAYFKDIRDKAFTKKEVDQDHALDLEMQIIRVLSQWGTIKLNVFYQFIFLKLLSEIDRADRRTHNAYGRRRQTLGVPQCILSQVIIEWMNPNPKSVVFNPNSGFGYVSCMLPDTCHLICGNDGKEKNFLLDLFTKDYNYRIEVCDTSFPKIDRFDYMIWFDDSDNKVTDGDICGKEYERIFNDYLPLLPEYGKAAFVISNEFLTMNRFWEIRKRLMEEELIDRIFYLSEGWSILFLNKSKPRKGVVRLINASYCRMSVGDLVKKMYNELSACDVPSQRIKETGYGIDINNKFGQEVQLPLYRDKRIIRLNEVLTAYKLNSLGVNVLQRVDFKPRPDYSPYNAKILSNETGKDFLLANIFSTDYFQPYIFKASTDNVSYYHEEYEIFLINTEKINSEYLIGELNKPYFKKQLFSGKYANVRKNSSEELNDLFLSLCIYVPDCTTPLEREKIFFDEERRKYLYLLNKSHGYDMDKESEYKGTYLPIGVWLNGKYQIERRITRGGFGMTYKAKKYEVVDGQMVVTGTVAIKEFFMRNFQTRDPNTFEVSPLPSGRLDNYVKAREKFMNEAKKIMDFKDCPHIVNVYDTFDENNTSYYVMEYIEGSPLDSYLEQSGDRLPEYEALNIIRQVASALKEMHTQHMNHLDVKPSNIMIDQMQNNRVVLIDFGTAHMFHEDSQLNTTILPISSGGYTAPEIGRTFTDFSPAADIYSLGGTLYFLLTEESPCSAREMQQKERPEQISEGTWYAIQKAMRLYPQERPQSVDEFLELLGV